MAKVEISPEQKPNFDHDSPHAILQNCFQSVVSGLDVFKDNRFDVEQLHSAVRRKIEDLCGALAKSPGKQSKIQIVQGVAGAGKTHLLRSLRNRYHANKSAFLGYIQLSQAEERFVFDYLAHLVNSLDYPYQPSISSATGLEILLDHYLSLEKVADEEIRSLLSDPEIPADALAELIIVIADDIISMKGLEKVEPDVVRALLYLKQPNAQVHNRILKFLKGMPLSSSDLGFISALSGVGHRPHRLFASLAMLIHGMNNAVLIFAVDQIDDLIGHEHGRHKWQSAISAIIELWNETPNSLFVISTLEGFYTDHKHHLLESQRDRLGDEEVITLPNQVQVEQIDPLIQQRLVAARKLIADLDDDYLLEDIPPWFAEKLAGQTIRKILKAARDWLESGNLGEEQEEIAKLPILERQQSGSARQHHFYNDDRQALGEHVENQGIAAASIDDEVRRFQPVSGLGVVGNSGENSVVVSHNSSADFQQQKMQAVTVDKPATIVSNEMAKSEQISGEDAPKLSVESDIVDAEDFDDLSLAAVSQQDFQQSPERASMSENKEPLHETNEKKNEASSFSQAEESNEIATDHAQSSGSVQKFEIEVDYSKTYVIPVPTTYRDDEIAGHYDADEIDANLRDILFDSVATKSKERRGDTNKDVVVPLQSDVEKNGVESHQTNENSQESGDMQTGHRVAKKSPEENSSAQANDEQEVSDISAVETYKASTIDHNHNEMVAQQSSDDDQTAQQTSSIDSPHPHHQSHDSLTLKSQPEVGQQAQTLDGNGNEVGHNEVGHNEVGYNEVGHNELSPVVAQPIALDLTDLPSSGPSRNLALLAKALNYLPEVTCGHSDQVQLRRSPVLVVDFVGQNKKQSFKLYWSDRPAQGGFLQKQVQRYFRLSGSQTVFVCHLKKKNDDERGIADSRDYCFSKNGVFLSTEITDWGRLEDALVQLTGQVLSAEQALTLPLVAKFYDFLVR